MRRYRAGYRARYRARYGDRHWGRLAPSLVLTAALVAPVAATGAGPVPATLETYRDWTIACDNGGRCETASLAPENDADYDAQATVFIERDGGPDAQPKVTISLPKQQTGTVDIRIDGKTAASAPVKDADVVVSGQNAFALVTALARGSRFEVAQTGKTIAHASLNGSGAALRYMDARQSRAGTVTALIAKGPLGARAVKTPPALPTVKGVAVPPEGAKLNLWKAEAAQAEKLTQCAAENASPTLNPELYALGGDKVLVLLPCGAGAYNFLTMPLIASGKAGRRTLAFAKFDYKPGWTEDAAKPMLINASWLAKDATLSSYAKGRGIGDCGGSETYVWDGAMFRLVEATAMGECRGAWSWLTTWRAKVVK